MILRSFLHDDPVAISYLVGCAGAGVGAVVDPLSPPEVYSDAARRAGLELRAVIDTHGHADHASSGRALAAASGAEYVLGAGPRTGAATRTLADGEELTLGNVVLRVIHTPGHTPEHVSLLVIDRTRGPDPWCALTGHTLMVGDMGRTELAGSPVEGANALFDSAERLRGLDDHVVVLPGAFAGSVCGRGLSGCPTSTIGFERRHNTAFGILDRATFVERMLQHIPEPPRGAAAMRFMNLGGPG